MPTSFDKDIRPLFRPIDIAQMKQRKHFDLSRYADVVAHAAKILQRLEDGDMPCDGAWPPDQVALFAQWIADGKTP